MPKKYWAMTRRTMKEPSTTKVIEKLCWESNWALGTQGAQVGDVW